MKATSLRTTMIFAVFIIVLIATTGFYYAQGWLSEFATEVNNTTSKPKVGESDSDAQALKQLQNEIASNQASGNKANSITVSSQNYQTQVTQDLNKYASDNSISITNYSFEKPAGIKTSPSVNGSQSNFVTITLSDPIPFTNLMKFIKSIESNLPKMQLTGINLSRASNSDSDVTVEPLVIEVYTKL